MRPVRYMLGTSAAMLLVAMFTSTSAHENVAVHAPEGKRLFERETFEGNGRTCSTVTRASSRNSDPAESAALLREPRLHPRIPASS